MNALPVARILTVGVQMPAIHFRTVLRFLSPLILLFVALIAGVVMSGTDGTAPMAPGLSLMILVFVIGVLAAMARFTVACHRAFILGADAVADDSVFTWSAREWRLMGWWFGLGLCALGIAFPVALVLSPFMGPLMENMTPEQIQAPGLNELYLYKLAVGAFVAYFIARLSLVLPATALDREASLGWAWRLSEGNGLSLYLVVGVPPLVMDVVANTLVMAESVLVNSIMVLIWFYFAVATVAFLSLAYRALTEEPEPPDRSPGYSPTVD